MKIIIDTVLLDIYLKQIRKTIDHAIEINQDEASSFTDLEDKSKDVKNFLDFMKEQMDMAETCFGDLRMDE